MDIDHLIAGLRRFCESGPEYRPDAPDAARPRVMVIACADLEADPQHISAAAAGELFVIRNLAAIVPPYAPEGSTQDSAAALEFGVRKLGVGHILVLGHSGCAGMKALLDAGESAIDDPIVGEFMPRWLALAVPGLAKAMRPGVTTDLRARVCEMEAVRLSLENLMSYPWIVERVMARQLHLHGWYMDLARGVLERLNPESDEFEAV
jgi:carbonic anhydrase